MLSGKNIPWNFASKSFWIASGEMISRGNSKRVPDSSSMMGSALSMTVNGRKSVSEKTARTWPSSFSSR